MAEYDTPQPSPVHSPPNGILSLSDQINASTRSTHTQLNRLITARLPLALPPFATNPSTYISGLLFIAPIYITFESAWQDILNAPSLPTSLAKASPVGACTLGKPLLDSHRFQVDPNIVSKPLVNQASVCSRTQSLLSHLRLPGLLRSSRLREDIRSLSGGISQVEVETQLEKVSGTGKLAEFINHITESVQRNPHVLLAYAWVLYMALFSGGRYLRASLITAGQDFWLRTPSPVRPYSLTGSNSDEKDLESAEAEDLPIKRPNIRRASNSETSLRNSVPGMQFFNFTGNEDGKDLKDEFKRRITEAEILLSSGEKDDIIMEAEKIFSYMVDMVAELDNVFDTNEDVTTLAKQQESKSFWRSRDSVFVARDRMSRRKDSSYVTENRNRGSSSSSIENFKISPGLKSVHFAESVKVHLAGLGRGVEAITKPIGRRFSTAGPILFAANTFSNRSRGGISSDGVANRMLWKDVWAASEGIILVATGLVLALVCAWGLFWLSA